MPDLHVQPLGKSLKLQEGESVRDVLIRNHIHLKSSCGGQGICGQCLIWVQEKEEIPETKHKNISKAEAEKGLRLACQVFPDRDLSITLKADHEAETPEAGTGARILGWEGFSPSSLDTAVQVKREGDLFFLKYENAPARKLPNWSEDYVPKGLALDLGTTTLVTTLISLSSGKELAWASSLNPQIDFGSDVLSRIKQASNAKGLKELSQSIRQGVNTLIKKTCADSGSSPWEILDLTLGGNPTMLQILAGMDPSALGQSPFRTDLSGGRSYPAEKFGLNINPQARSYLPPVLHAFIGSDVSAGLLVCREFFQDQKSVLYLDLGTNGEICLNAKGNRYATSAAAGPAFEGMGLSCGMSAANGAVEGVYLENGRIQFSVLADGQIKGICGSGIVDLIAVLLKLNIVDKSGRMLRLEELEGKDLQGAESRIKRFEDGLAFELAKGVYFTQNDLRQVQLAKAAVKTAADMLLEEANIAAEKLDQVVVAGAFGYYLNPENLEYIGLIPSKASKGITYAGNASHKGCLELLTDLGKRRFLEEKIKEVKQISIAEQADFMERFVQNISF